MEQIFFANSTGQASPAITKVGEAQGAAYTLFETIERNSVIDPTSDKGIFLLKYSVHR